MESDSLNNSKFKATISEEEWQNLATIFFSNEENLRFTDHGFPNNINSILDNDNSRKKIINNIKSKNEVLKRSKSK